MKLWAGIRNVCDALKKKVLGEKSECQEGEYQNFLKLSRPAHHHNVTVP